MYNEELQDKALSCMVAAGFPIGRIVHPVSDDVIPNALVSIIINGWPVGEAEGGPFWYGDVTKTDYDRIQAIATELNCVLSVESQTSTKWFNVDPLI